MTFTVKVEEEHGEVRVFRVDAEIEGPDGATICAVRTDTDIRDWLCNDGDRAFLWQYLKADVESQISDASRRAYLEGGITTELSVEELMERYGKVTS
jgi:translation initiation factor 2 beta subunit (eIF-2beta)/eIF-5